MGPVQSKIDIAMEDGSYWNARWRAENLKRQSAEVKAQKEKEKWRKEAIAKSKNTTQKFKTARRIRKEMRWIAPAEEQQANVTMKLQQAHGVKGQNDQIRAKEMKMNLKRFGKNAKKKTEAKLNLI